jgi:hypothetical protein
VKAFLKHSVLFGWVLPYTAILVIPIFLSLAVYLYAYQIISSNVEEIYTSSLDQVRIETDSMINAVHLMASQLAADDNTRRLTLVRDELYPEDRITAYKLYAELNKYFAISSLASDIFVMFHRVRGVVGLDGYFPEDLYFRPDIDFKKIIDEIWQTGQRKSIVRVGDTLLFLLTTPKNNLSDSSATVVIAINKHKFEDHFRIATLKKNGSIIYISDGKGNILYASSDEDEIEIDKTQYLILQVASVTTDLNYFYLILRRQFSLN